MGSLQFSLRSETEIRRRRAGGRRTAEGERRLAPTLSRPFACAAGPVNRRRTRLLCGRLHRCTDRYLIGGLLCAYLLAAEHFGSPKPKERKSCSIHFTARRLTHSTQLDSAIHSAPVLGLGLLRPAPESLMQSNMVYLGMAGRRRASRQDGAATAANLATRVPPET